MANIRKSFNFRNGVQVDEDNLIVNSNGLVGVGTTVPTESLDVRGTLKVVGVATVQDAFIGVGTVQNKLSVGIVSITEDGYIQASSGIVTFTGDGSNLTNIPTSQWTDIDAGLGFTSIYNTGNVGVQTVDPRFAFQVGGNPVTTQVGFSSGVGINSVGDILATGIVTAASFSGKGGSLIELDADNISGGTLGLGRLPDNLNKPTGIATFQSFVGALTGNVFGDVTGSSIIGIASTARGLTGTPDIQVGFLTATRVALTGDLRSTADIKAVGSIDATNDITTSSGKVGIGSTMPDSQLEVVTTGSNATIEVVSNTNNARIAIGQSIGVGNSSAILQYNSKKLEFINNDTGSVDTIIHDGQPGVSTGNFRWIYGQSNTERMTLTYDGNLGISDTSPEHKLSVGGASTFTGAAYFNDDVTIDGTLNATIVIDGEITNSLNITSGVSTIFDLDITSKITTANGAIGLRTDDISGDAALDVTQGIALFQTVGVGSTSPRAAADFSGGTSGTSNFIILPNVSNAERTGLNTETAPGALIFNTDTNKLQFYTGSAWETVTSS